MTRESAPKGASQIAAAKRDQGQCTAPIRLSDSLKQILLDAFTVSDLRHIVAALDARDHVPGPLATELAEELATILSAGPMESEDGPIYNRPTVGWFRNRDLRIADQRPQVAA